MCADWSFLILTAMPFEGKFCYDGCMLSGFLVLRRMACGWDVGATLLVSFIAMGGRN